ncbi:MAG: hypothetical protein Q9226_005148 [Calogaya cf. arnoldii]
MRSLDQHTIYTAETRPECWDALRDPKHPLNAAWPVFLDNDTFQVQLADKVLEYDSLRRFQFAIIERDTNGIETLIAHARSIPFFWPELEEVRGTLSTFPHVLRTLPDRGWDSIVARAFRQHCIREGLPLPFSCITATDYGSDLGASSHMVDVPMNPNTLSALSITVRADRRKHGFAESLIEAMKQVARKEGLRVLVAPLRPTRKSEYPWVSMEKYISCSLSESPTAPLKTATAAARNNDAATHGLPFRSELPFDPWLRKHVRLGGSLVKIAPSSMIVRGSFAEWQTWTGIDFDSLVRAHGRAAEEELMQPESDNIGQGVFEVAIPGGLVPVRVSTHDRMCTYVEPNVWLYHDVS